MYSSPKALTTAAPLLGLGNNDSPRSGVMNKLMSSPDPSCLTGQQPPQCLEQAASSPGTGAGGHSIF